MTDDEILSRRFWLIKNIDWLMGEVNFHKDNQDVYNNDKIKVWEFDQEKGSAKIE